MYIMFYQGIIDQLRTPFVILRHMFKELNQTLGVTEKYMYIVIWVGTVGFSESTR